MSNSSAIKVNQDTTQALNATQGHKRNYSTSNYQPEQNQPGYINTGFQSAPNTTQGHKPSYQQSIFIDPK